MPRQALSPLEIRRIAIVLRILQNSPQQKLPESEIIRIAENSGWLFPIEKASVESRSDSQFANQVHNLVSHRDSRRNPIREGLVVWHTYTSEFALTSKGRKFLADMIRKLIGESIEKADEIVIKQIQVIDDWLAQKRAEKSPDEPVG